MRGASLLPLLALAACATTDHASTPSLGAPPLCAPGVRLGDVVVAPLSRWRSDQKEKEERTAIAQRAIGEAFKALPCASSARVLPMAPDGDISEKLAQAKADGFETAVVIRVDELGPILIVSVPALWSTWSDVKFNLEAVDLVRGETRLRLDHHRKVGGAFQLRGVGPLQEEMEAALAEVLWGKAG